MAKKKLAQPSIEEAMDRQFALSHRFQSTLDLTPDLGPLVRAARALLGVTQQELADHAGVGLATLIRLESPDYKGTSHPRSVLKIMNKLESEGVEFVLGSPENGSASGVLRRDIDTSMSFGSTPEKLREIADGKRRGFPSERANVNTLFEVQEVSEEWSGLVARARA